MPFQQQQIDPMFAIAQRLAQQMMQHGTPTAGGPTTVGVPGQLARDVQASQPMTPAQRMDQWMPQGQPTPFAGAMPGVHPGMPPTPTPGTAYPGGAPAPFAAPVPSAAAQDQGNWLGLPPGVSGGISDAMTGLSQADPTAPPLTAFAQGFAGTQGSRQSREDRKRALAAATEEQQYRRGRDTASDTRADRRDALDARREDRYASNEERDARLAERKAQRDERAAQVEETKTFAQVDKILGDTGKDGHLSESAFFKLQNLRQKYRDSITPDALGGAMGDTETTKTDLAVVEEKMKVFDEELQRKYNEAIGGDQSAPEQGGETVVPKSEGTGGQSGSGSFEAPYNFGATTEQEAATKAFHLPKGAYFYDHKGIMHRRT